MAGVDAAEAAVGLAAEGARVFFAGVCSWSLAVVRASPRLERADAVVVSSGCARVERVVAGVSGAAADLRFLGGMVGDGVIKNAE